MFKIMIDPGHGGNEFGAISDIKEKDLNLDVAQILKSNLERLGFSVAMTRHQDIDVSLESRCETANLWKADIFVSIHHNAFDGNASGYEIYNYTGSEKGNKLANLVGKYFDEVQHKRYIGGGMWAGAKPDSNYYVLKHTNMPAILTEFCFIDNYKDFLKYNATKEATMICKGICDYFGVEYEEKKDIDIDILRKSVSKLQEEIDTIKSVIK